MASNKSTRLILGWVFLSLLFFSLLGGKVDIVVGAEEEEEDNFTIMPNWRWENLTTTSSQVSETLIGDYYAVNSSTNTNFAKGRKLNSRDFYFNTRFQLDIGTTAGFEYWEDVEENKSDFDDGTTEGWTKNSGETEVSVSNGWLNCSLSSPESFINIRCDSLSINSSVYKWLKFEFRVETLVGWLDGISVYDYEPLPPDLVAYDGTNRDDGTYTFLVNLGNDADWSGTETGLALLFAFTSVSLYNKIDINYTALCATEDDSYLDGFKFGLLNEDQEEGMAFQFSHDYQTAALYNLDIDMTNTSGDIVLSYNNSFNYSRLTDGWLYLEVEWNLDKKGIKLEFTYENQSSIIKTRKLTDLYSTIGTEPLQLLEPGFPSIVLNNTLANDGRDIFSYVLIDYVDSNWDLISWYETESPYSHPIWGSCTNHDDTRFTSISPYGYSLYQKNVSDSQKFYRLDVDRLDGISFDLDLTTDNLDASSYGDRAVFSIEMWNVQPNGTLIRIFTLLAGTDWGGSIGTYCELYNTTNDELQRLYVNAKEDWTLDFSFYFEDKEKVVLQYEWVTDTTFDVQRTFTSGSEISESFTKEFVFVIGYRGRTSDNDATDDSIDLIMGGFDITRKDIIGTFVSLILTPFLNIIAFFIAPIIIILQWLTLQFLRGLSVLGDFLEPLLAAIVSILEPAIGLLQGAVEGLWNLLWDLAEDAGEFIYDIFVLLLPLLLDLLEQFANIITGLVFWIWNFGGNPGDGLPDFLSWLELLLDYIIAFVQWSYDTAVAVLQLFVDMSWVILVGWWFWAVFIQFARANGNPMEGLSNFIDAYFTPLINLVFFPIPQGIVATLWLILLLPNDFFFFTMMG